MKFIRILQCLLLAASATLVTLVLTGIADSAPSPNTCVSTSDMPRTYTHGSPLTGLTPPSDYYYLSVTPGQGCAVSLGDTVHLVATIRIDDIVPSVGAPGNPPDPNRIQQWWIQFHVGTGPTGHGFGIGNDPAHVTQTGGEPTSCNPAPQFLDDICLSTSGQQTITMRYDGPDMFGLAFGGAAGFRIGNADTDGAIVTDYATETLLAGTPSVPSPPEVPTPTASKSVAPVVGMASTPDGGGYWAARSDGTVVNFGDASFDGSMAGSALNKPIVGMAATADGGGYWLVATDGGIFSFGDAQFYGSTGNIRLNEPIVGMAATPDGMGYWFVASDGGIFTGGDAPFYGSTGNLHLNQPVVGMAATADGRGYYLAASDGGIFTFGDARFQGSMGATVLNRPVVGLSIDRVTSGYWEVAADGGIFSFNAPFFGSAGNLPLVKPIVGMTTTPTGQGYRFVASDGGIFDYGDAQFYGSAA